MTNEEMNKLGDIIVAKIVAMQERMDAEFFENAQEQFGEAYNLELSDEASLDLAINDCNEKLERAVNDEDYKLAAELQQQLFNLYDQQKD
jgi:hypothetical protein